MIELWISDSEMSLKGSRNIEKYLEFLDLWYDEHCDDLSDEELNTFKIKVWLIDKYSVY